MITEASIRNCASAVGAICALTVLSASGLMNWQFGYALGKSPFDGYLYASIFIALDGVKVLAPFFIIWAVADRAYGRACVTSIIFAVCIAASVTSAIGYNMSNLTAVQTTQTVHSKQLAFDELSLTSDQQRLVAVRLQLASLAALERSKHYLVSSKKRRRKALLGEQVTLKKDIAQYKLNLNFSEAKVRFSNAVSSRQAAFSEIFQIDPETSQLIFFVLLILSVELLGTWGFWISLSHFDGGKKKEQVKAPVLEASEATREPFQEGSNIISFRKPRGSSWTVKEDAVGDFLKSLDQSEFYPAPAWDKFKGLGHPVGRQQFYSITKEIAHRHGFRRTQIKSRKLYVFDEDLKARMA